MFRNVYNKEIQDPEQPLLVHRPKDREVQRVIQYVDIDILPCQNWLVSRCRSLPWPEQKKFKAQTGFCRPAICFVRHP